VFRVVLVVMLVAALLVGQTFCCCTAGRSALLGGGQESCCCSDQGTCPAGKTPESCPCKQKRVVADVGAQISVDLSFEMQQLTISLTAVLAEPVVEVVGLLDRQDAIELVRTVLPRTDRVARSELLLC